jgi:acyl carrier protein
MPLVEITEIIMLDTTAATIRSFIVENFLFGDSSSPFPDTASLIENGIVDSTGVLELVAFIEERYGIIVADSEIIPANLDNIESLCAYIDRKTNTGAQAA